MKKDFSELPLLVGILLLMELFDVSEATIRRWLAEARAGRSRFPLNIDMGRGKKGKLVWNRDDIIAFCQSADNPQPLAIESPTQRENRNAVAMRELEAAGVKVNVPTN